MSQPVRIFWWVPRAEQPSADHDGTAEPLLVDLTAAQRHAVTSDAAPLCVIAAAGAGKTRVLTRRIAYRCATGAADPARVLALTFTRRAAAELADRLRLVGLREQVAAGTFHAVAAAQLRRWWADRGQPAPTLLDRKGRILGPLIAERPALAGASLAELAGLVEWAQARRVGPDELPRALSATSRVLPVPAEEIATLLGRYQHEKRRRGLVDFDDLLERCADAMERDPTFAAAQRWMWRHLYVDEVQDLNPLQHRLLLAWLGERVDLCVVGDPHQAIYGWNGADPDLLDRFAERWPSAEVVHLDANHRCTPQIVAAAASVLGPGGSHLVSSRPEGAAVVVRSWSSGQAEAAGVASALRAAHDDGMAWSTLAVLTRTNAQSVTLAEACRSASVPVRVPDQERLLEHPAARTALQRLSSGTAERAPLAVAVTDLEAWAGDETDPEAASVLDALAGLARQARRLDEAATVTDWIAGLPALAGSPGGDAVTICSFHRAKGLEWRAVWVCGLEDGLVPIGHASSRAALAEERRLLYVALTRATDLLTCCWARERRFGNHPVPRRPSPWLPATGEQATDDAADDRREPGRATPERPAAAATGGTARRAEPTAAADWSARFGDQRDRLSGGRRRPGGARHPTLPPGWPPPDPTVLEALRSWRAATARASAVPAPVVLHDTVLIALASRRPADETGLLAIPGLGPVKVDRFGPRLLRIVAEASSPDASPPGTPSRSAVAGAHATGYD